MYKVISIMYQDFQFLAHKGLEGLVGISKLRNFSELVLIRFQMVSDFKRSVPF